MTKYDECVKKGYHDWVVSGVNGSNPDRNEVDLYCAHCNSEGDADVSVRVHNDEEEDEE